MINPYNISAKKIENLMTLFPGVFIAPKFREGGSLFYYNKNMWIEIGMMSLKRVGTWKRIQKIDERFNFPKPNDGLYKKPSSLSYFDPKINI